MKRQQTADYRDGSDEASPVPGRPASETGPRGAESPLWFRDDALSAIPAPVAAAVHDEPRSDQ